MKREDIPKDIDKQRNQVYSFLNNIANFFKNVKNFDINEYTAANHENLYELVVDAIVDVANPVNDIEKELWKETIKLYHKAYIDVRETEGNELAFEMFYALEFLPSLIAIKQITTEITAPLEDDVLSMIGTKTP